jgi:type II secretory pathway pseudopilin PulG
MKPEPLGMRRIEARADRAAAFTLTEMMVASGVSGLVMAGAMLFFWFGSRGLSGVTAQALCNQQAGNAVEFVQTRARLAVCVSNDSSGNTLTLGFDDDPTRDSDGDGITYNDKNHFERFQFRGVNGSGAANSKTNSLIYIPNISNAASQILIPSGVRNLPGCNIFFVTNGATIIIRFGLADSYVWDRYQSIDIQGTALLLNRPSTTNIIGILP